MANTFDTAGVAIRENRLGSITGYCGDAQDLVGKSRGCTFAGMQRSFTQSGTCPSFCSTLQLSMVQDAALINHAPAGCAGDFAMFNLYNRYGQGKRKMPVSNARLISTNLTEHDTIFGAKQKLYDTILETFRRFHPKAIFVTASCASGIIGEDIEATADEAQEAIGVPVAFVNCEGFRSQVWATGWDAAYNAILQKIVKPAKEKHPERINIITFIGENYYSELLGPLGLEPNLIVPFVGVDALSRLSEAGATAQMCPTLGTYFAAGLEKLHGVPEIKSPPPFGLPLTDRWLRELGEVTGKQAEVESLIKSEREAIKDELKVLQDRFKGLTCFVAAGPAHGHSLMAVIKELGMDLVGGAGLHHDSALDNGDPGADTLDAVVKNYGNFNYSVNNKQPFELTNLILKLKPDVLVLRHPSMIILGAKLGIPTIFMDDEHLGLGYRGLVRYGRKISNWIRNPSIERTLARHNPPPYTRWWLERHPHHFLGVNKDE